MSKILALLFLLAALTAQAQQPTRLTIIHVTHVKDADTFDGVICDSFPVTVRLEWIDALEKDQPGGLQAKWYADSLLGGETVLVYWHKKDGYGRLIGTVVLQSGDTLNKELVRAGWAMHYVEYGLNPEYQNAELAAMLAQRGMWQTPGAKIAPWVWRKERRDAK